MRSRSPLWCIQRCRRTTATTKWKSSYSKPSLPSTFLKRLLERTSSVRFLQYEICLGEGGPSRRATRTRARVLQEMRPLRFEARDERRQQRILTRTKADEMLGVTERPRSPGGGRGGQDDGYRPALSPCRARRCGAAAGAAGHVTRASLRGATGSRGPEPPCPACCCPKTVPRMRGAPAVRGMCSGCSMRRPASAIPPSSWMKKGL